MNRKKITNGLLSACVCATMVLSAPFNASANIFADEKFDGGITNIKYRKNTPSGTVYDAMTAIENGKFKLVKNAGDGIALAYSEFPLQTDGSVTFSADIASNISDGVLFKMSSEVMGDGVSVVVKDGRLVLMCGGSEADAGAFSGER